MYRSREGLGVWEHKGKVAAVGIGHSPTARRWDEQVESSIGTWSIIALRNAMEDAGVTPDQVDGMVIVPAATTGDRWSPTHRCARRLRRHLRANRQPQRRPQFHERGMAPQEHAGAHEREVHYARPNLHVRRRCGGSTGRRRRPHQHLPGPEVMEQPLRAIRPRVRQQRPGHCSGGLSVDQPVGIRRRCLHVRIPLRPVLPQVRQEPRHDGALSW